MVSAYLVGSPAFQQIVKGREGGNFLCNAPQNPHGVCEFVENDLQLVKRGVAS